MGRQTFSAWLRGSERTVKGGGSQAERVTTRGTCTTCQDFTARPVNSALRSWALLRGRPTWRAGVCFQQCWHIPRPKGVQAWASDWGS